MADTGLYTQQAFAAANLLKNDMTELELRIELVLDRVNRDELNGAEWSELVAARGEAEQIQRQLPSLIGRLGRAIDSMPRGEPDQLS